MMRGIMLHATRSWHWLALAFLFMFTAEADAQSVQRQNQAAKGTKCVVFEGKGVRNKCSTKMEVLIWTVGGGCYEIGAGQFSVSPGKWARFIEGCGESRRWVTYILACDHWELIRSECTFNDLRREFGYPIGKTIRNWDR